MSISSTLKHDMTKKMEYDRVVRAVHDLRQAGSMLEIIARDQGIKTLDDAARRVVEIEKSHGGVMLVQTRGRENANERRDCVSAVATVLASVVNREDTPCVDAVCQAQLAGRPSADDLARTAHRFQDMEECFDVVASVAGIDEQLRAARRVMWNSASRPNEIATDIVKQFHDVLDVSAADMWLVNDLGIPQLSTLHVTSPDTFDIIFQNSRSPAGYVITLLKRLPLPDDIVRQISKDACRDKRNALHCALAKVDTPSARGCREHLDLTLAVIITCLGIFGSKHHLGHVIARLRSQEAVVRRIERVLVRETRTGEKRNRGSGVIVHNTVIVCDTNASRQLRTYAGFRQRGLVVRHILGSPDLSTALHADIIIINPLATSSISQLRFRRCVWLNTPANTIRIRAERNWTVRVASCTSPMNTIVSQVESESVGVGDHDISALRNFVVPL